MRQFVEPTRLTDIALALWFTILACVVISDFIGPRPGPDSLPAVARMLSKACVFSFYVMLASATLIRARPLAKAAGLLPRVSALLGSYLSLALPSLPARTDLGTVTHLVSATFILVGIGFAAVALLHLRHSFSVNAEARRLVTIGPYAVMRHPLYVAEELALVGIFMQYASGPAAAIVVAQIVFQLQRVRNEEIVLRRTFPEYGIYAARTPQFIAGVW
jgi:protein-S-isoprenylcysteine O-methyltransferase Ste14